MEEFSSIRDLANHLKEEEARTGEKYYYRGQLNKDWKIQSTISRENYNKKEIEKTAVFVNWLMSNKLLNIDKSDPLANL